MKVLQVILKIQNVCVPRKFSASWAQAHVLRSGMDTCVQVWEMLKYCGNKKKKMASRLIDWSFCQPFLKELLVLAEWKPMGCAIFGFCRCAHLALKKSSQTKWCSLCVYSAEPFLLISITCSIALALNQDSLLLLQLMSEDDSGLRKIKITWE